MVIKVKIWKFRYSRNVG